MWFPLLRALHELQFDPPSATPAPASNAKFFLFFVLEFYLVITAAKTVTKNHV
jgi:hypothetical protein